MINPKIFWEYLDDKNDYSSFVASSVTYKLKCNPRDKWNEIGREILEENKLNELAKKMFNYLQKSKCESFLACFCREHIGWNPNWDSQDPDFSKLEHNKPLRIKILEYLNEKSLLNYTGPILLESLLEIEEFLHSLIAYPFIFYYQDIYIYCLDFPVVLKLSGHLNVMLYTSSKEIYRDFKEFADDNELTVITGHPPSLICRGLATLINLFSFFK